MRHPLFRHALAWAAAAALIAPSVAQAESLVLPGSAYQVYFAGSDSGSTAVTVSFDGVDEWFTGTLISGGDLLFGIQEVETDHGGGRWSIDITLMGDTQLFPVSGETGWANVGFDTMPLQLTRAVQVDSAVVSFRLQDRSVYADDSWDITRFATRPWDGYMSQGNTYGFTEVGGKDIREVNFHFEVSAVPEPASLPLWLGGTVALLAWRRRASRAA